MINAVKNKIEGTFYNDINKSLKSVIICSCFFIAIFICLYGYFIGAISFSIIKEKSIKENTRSLVSSISQEELKYFTLQKQLTEEYGKEIGMVKSQNVSYAETQRTFAWNARE